MCREVCGMLLKRSTGCRLVALHHLSQCYDFQLRSDERRTCLGHRQLVEGDHPSRHSGLGLSRLHDGFQN